MSIGLYKCGVFNCNGLYNDENKRCVFKLPTDSTEQENWINSFPVCGLTDHFVIDGILALRYGSPPKVY